VHFVCGPATNEFLDDRLVHRTRNLSVNWGLSTVGRVRARDDAAGVGRPANQKGHDDARRLDQMQASRPAHLTSDLEDDNQLREHINLQRSQVQFHTETLHELETRLAPATGHDLASAPKLILKYERPQVAARPANLPNTS
jgi:hypothetical protein